MTRSQEKNKVIDDAYYNDSLWWGDDADYYRDGPLDLIIKEDIKLKYTGDLVVSKQMLGAPPINVGAFLKARKITYSLTSPLDLNKIYIVSCIGEHKRTTAYMVQVSDLLTLEDLGWFHLDNFVVVENG
jgi:hypothetical protein